MRKLLVALLVAMVGSVGMWADAAAFDAKFKEQVKEAKSQLNVVTLDQVKAMMDANENFTILDVRDPDEVSGFGRPDWKAYKNISRGKLEPLLGKSGLSVDDKVVVFCKTGARAALAAQTLKNYGFKNVMVADKGMDTWIEKNLPDVEVAAQCK
jgi:rhodanese-related sulfurtransferase